MIIAHLSDLHVRGDEPLSLNRLFNKRATGYVNLRFRRGSVHKTWAVQALARELRAQGVDHVAITGDISNLALEDEFAAARRVIEEDLALSSDQVSLVPGNHDVYTRGSMHKRRFAHYFAPYLTGDVPDAAIDHPAGPFPFVRLRGDVALVGLSSAVPSPPMFSYGRLGEEQRDALRRLLVSPPLRHRYVVALLHHPPYNPPSPLKALRNGLHDAVALRACFPAPALLLHGHLHERMLRGEPGALQSCGATSASLLDEHPARGAGFNLYEVDHAGLRHARAVVLEGTDRFVERSLPRV